MSRTPRNNICECHCGTRIDINPKLVEERQAWREKCVALEESYRTDVAALKEKIYKECSLLMEKEFKTKEDGFRLELAKKQAEIHALNVKLQSTEARNHTISGEYEHLRGRFPTLQESIRQLEDKLEHQRRINLEDVRHLRQAHSHELEALEQEKNELLARDKKNYQAQICHLRHQIGEFQSKYRVILPEVEKLRSTVHTKTQQNEDLKRKLAELGTEHQQKVTDLNKKIGQLKKPDLSYELKTLQRELEERTKELHKLRNEKPREIVKTEIKYETVYVDRPVEVERIVEKVVEVEKIVKEFVQPKQPLVINEVKCSQQEDPEEYEHLMVEINNRTRFIGELQSELSQRDRELQDYERVVGDYQRNIQKYKNERVKLAATIGQKNREIESLEHRIHSIMQQVNSQSQPNEDRIIVNVKKDGTYTSSIGGNQPAQTRVVPKENKKDNKQATVPVARRK